ESRAFRSNQQVIKSTVSFNTAYFEKIFIDFVHSFCCLGYNRYIHNSPFNGETRFMAIESIQKVLG
ncbi:hypothetical protein V7111_13815, partial [Neobacillus niacini]|uniref:hypothetical protein n=1 Tax=Neobacillus niacini TaxID=86668 RepID=UPI003000ADF3